VPLPDIGDQLSKKDSIGIKELYAVVTAAFTWVHLLLELHVPFLVDNSAAVAAIYYYFYFYFILFYFFASGLAATRT